MSDEPKDTSGIELYLHCAQCLEIIPPDVTPRDWSMTQAGIMEDGRIRVWCNRCQIPVATLRLQSESLTKLLARRCNCPKCTESGSN